jgi:hypothetical protein
MTFPAYTLVHEFSTMHQQKGSCHTLGHIRKLILGKSHRQYFFLRLSIVSDSITGMHKKRGCWFSLTSVSFLEELNQTGNRILSHALNLNISREISQLRMSGVFANTSPATMAKIQLMLSHQRKGFKAVLIPITQL